MGPPLPLVDRAAGNGRHAADRPDDPGRARIRPEGGDRGRADGRIEQDYLGRAIRAWRARDDVFFLGNLETRRLGVLSVIFRDVHHNLAARLLNDLFGIQVRAGCMCAGPYGHLLLHIDEDRSKAIRHRLDEGHLGEKPGWVRISLAPTVSEEEFQALLEAVDYVARRGARAPGRLRAPRRDGRMGAADARPAPRGKDST